MSRGYHWQETKGETYIQDIDFSAQNANVNNNVIYFDPGRRDMLFGMHEQGELKRFSRLERSNRCRVKKYRRILSQRRTPEVGRHETNLSSAPPKVTLNPTLYQVYLIVRCRSEQALTRFYANEMAEDGATPLHRKLKLSSVLNRNLYHRF